MIEGEADFFEADLVHGVAEAGFFLGVEQQETTATRADQFATQRPVLQG